MCTSKPRCISSKQRNEYYNNENSNFIKLRKNEQYRFSLPLISNHGIINHMKHSPIPSIMKPQKRIRKRMSPVSLDLMRKQKEEIRDAKLEKWLQGTGRFPKSRWRIKEKRSLKEWFDRLDQDGSGDIDVEELADPLLSSGITKSVAEVKSLVGSFDDDNSGGIGFQEFLSIMKTNYISTNNENDNNITKNPQKNSKTTGKKQKRQHEYDKKTKKIPSINDRENRNDDYSIRHKYTTKLNTKKDQMNKTSNPIIKLQRLQKNGDLDINSVLALKRRKLLLDATMGEAQRRESALDELSRWKYEVKDMDGISKFRKLHEINVITNKLEKEKEEKQNFVSEMQGMIKKALESEDFKSDDIVRNEATVDKHLPKMPQNRKMLNQNVIILTRHSETHRPGGGRRALLYPFTSQNNHAII